MSLGVRSELLEDGIWIQGGEGFGGGTVDSHGDHRIAMAFAIAALRAKGETLIHGADAARISFPEFFDMLEGVVER
jgi:3-phosphoshikimate 1-carboxyvinyltransferase